MIPLVAIAVVVVVVVASSAYIFTKNSSSKGTIKYNKNNDYAEFTKLQPEEKKALLSEKKEPTGKYWKKIKLTQADKVTL